MRSTPVNKLALWLSWLAAAILALLPFHAFLTVWLSSAVGHYTLLRLWKEFLLIILSAGALYILIIDKRLRRQILASRITQIIGVYFSVTLFWGAAAYALEKTTLKALGFGLIVNLRFLAFFMAIWIIATKSQWLKRMWPKLLFLPAAIVILIGIMQRLVLPYDVLKHFGYNESTIFPYQTINRDINYPRIMSTLRGANPLGAYLILILSGAAVFFLKFKNRRLLWAIFGAVGLLALFFSYSRGAWIGAALSGLFLVWLSFKNRAAKWLTAAAVVIFSVGVVALAAISNNQTFENYFFHTSDRSTIAESSNEAHLSSKRAGLNEIAREPLGRGVGTAGPASVYNGKSRVADNYFIQLGQEIGWLGLGLFLIIYFLVARKLWHRRNDTLARILLVSFVGITAANMVAHAWTDDTLAYIWWGLAGIALAPAILTDRKPKAK